MKATPAILLLLAAGACAPAVPSEPTWVDDVRPILAANCIRCHSPPYIGGAPQTFRLDKYDEEFLPDLPIDEGDDPERINGAGSELLPMAIATNVEREDMPPRFPLSSRQIDVLVNWYEAGAPHGEARANNALPTMVVPGDLEIAEEHVALEYEIEDSDGDIVTGLVLADPGGGADPIVVSNELFVGRGRVKGHISPGTYELSAEIDDGNDTVQIELGTAVVP
jgi:hypothetical protein